MAGLKEIRNRIVSIKSTQQITSAMKMVSASKLRKAQNAIIKLRPYANKFNEILLNLSSEIENASGGKYAERKDIRKILLVPMSSNRGLCGSFNSVIIKATNKLIAEQYKENLDNSNLHLFCIGKKVYDYYNKRKFTVIDHNSEIFNAVSYEKAKQIAEKLIELYTTKEYDKIIIIYNKFKNAASQILTIEQFLPLIFEKQSEDKKGETIADYIYEPSQIDILDKIIPDYLKMNFYKTILESNASENGARMTAMHIATDNASEILKQLSLSYNKARQASITKELLEIVSGAEALNE